MLLIDDDDGPGREEDAKNVLLKGWQIKEEWGNGFGISEGSIAVDRAKAGERVVYGPYRPYVRELSGSSGVLATTVRRAGRRRYRRYGW